MRADRARRRPGWRNGAACRGSSRRGSSLPAFSFPGGQRGCDVRDELARELELGPAPEVVLAARVVELDRVVVGAERVLREIRGDQRHVLFRALFGGIAREVLALGGEADTERRVL